MKKLLPFALLLAFSVGCLSLSVGAAPVSEIEFTYDDSAVVGTDTLPTCSVADGAHYTIAFTAFRFCENGELKYTLMDGVWYDNIFSKISAPDLSSFNQVTLNFGIERDSDYTFSESPTVKGNGVSLQKSESEDYTKTCFCRNADDAISVFIVRPFSLSSGEPETSGTTDIVAIVPDEQVSFIMVIPDSTSVDGDNYSLAEVGAASVKDVTGADENTVISYTVSWTDFIKTDDETMFMQALYWLDDSKQNPLGSNPVTVYENKKIADPLPAIYVSIAEGVWSSALPGDYKSVLTFTFTATEKTE